jgi:alpha-L-fucosidase
VTMQPWFERAKLGIFVHWGIYAVRGVAESWSFFNGQISYRDYMAQCDGFTAASYDPDAWAGVFAEAGARYAVLTTKHHDGVALWDTAASDLSVVRRTPAGRDLIGPYAEAMRRHGLRTGLYFSHLDWSHPDYATIRPARVEQENRFAYPPAGQEDPAAWERFLAFQRAQIFELTDRFRPDLLWFDGDWERDERQWRMRELRADILARSPEVILNSRMLGYGDYATPEQGAPIEPPPGPWELCLTVNDSWGWQAHDSNQKSVRQLIQIFAETIGGGGNLLLDVGPRQDGTITDEQASRLRGLGAWIRQNSAAVYDTERGLPPGHFYGASTLAPDRRTVFLICFDRPAEYVSVRGLRSPIRRATVVSSGASLPVRSSGGLGEVPGISYVSVAGADLDEYATVIALELDGELALYRGGGRELYSLVPG